MKKILKVAGVIVLAFAVIGIWGDFFRGLRTPTDRVSGDVRLDGNILNVLQNVTIDASTPDSVMYQKRNITSPFGFGVEYAFQHDVDQTGVPEKIGPTNANWIKFAELYWEKVEPQAPRNGVHTYKWDEVDKRVKAWQANGVENLWFVMKTRALWAGTKPFTLQPQFLFGTQAGSLPSKDHFGNYQAWISAVVERYDGDGVSDMPGLATPIRYYEIESEAQHPVYWNGSAEEYVQLLKLAYEAAHRADPQTHVVLSGINFTDIFDDVPSKDVVLQRLSAIPLASIRELVARSLSFTFTSLDASNYYDDIEIHTLYNPEGVYADTQVLRNYLASKNITKTIWAGDATSNERLLQDPVGTWNLRMDPFVGRQYSDALKAKTGDWQNIKVWYETLQASQMLRKYVVTMHAGLPGSMMCCLEDWTISSWANNFTFGGLMNSDRTPRPAYNVLKKISTDWGSATSIERIKRTSDIYFYRITTPSKTFYVTWKLPKAKYTMTRAFETVKNDLPISAKKVKVTQLQKNGTLTDSEVAVTGNVLSGFTISELPTIIEVLP